MLKMYWDLGNKKIAVKIVYFGCAMSGKTTSLRYIFQEFGESLQSIETEAGRTLFFDCGSIHIKRGAWDLQINLWSATGQDFYAQTRPTVLVGVDGIVFVVDSQSHLLPKNLESWGELELLLGEEWKRIPLVICLNKRDAPDAITIHTLKAYFNINSHEIFETIAPEGYGVIPALQSLLKKVLTKDTGV
jgi:signal recognition particle receptor subunit beta